MTGAGSDRGFPKRGGASFAGADFSIATLGGATGLVTALVVGSLGAFSIATGAGKAIGLAGAGSTSGCAASGGALGVGMTWGTGLALGGGDVSGSDPGKPNKRGSILSVGKLVPE